MRKLITAAFVLTFFATVFSCAKIKEDFIIRGKWELQEAYLNHDDSRNFMEVVLTGYNLPDKCCQYIIDFQDDNIAFGYYYRYDSLQYVVRGTWDMEDKSHMYIDLDKYVKGSFKIKREGLRQFQLSTEENDAALLGIIITTPLEMHIERLKK